MGRHPLSLHRGRQFRRRDHQVGAVGRWRVGIDRQAAASVVAGAGAAKAAGVCMTKPLNPDDYLNHPERAVALLNAVIASGGDLKAVEQALMIVALALKQA